MAQTILVVDDKQSVQRLISDSLLSHGYQVMCASNGQEAQDAINRQSPALILLDIMMPQMDGYDFITRLRETSDLPVILITAKQQESDLIKGFELGADDYIAKPFKVNELLVRIKAVLKRTSSSFTENPKLKVANLILDTRSKELRIDDKYVELTLAELALLNLLMTTTERTLTKEELRNHLIHEGYSGSESTLKIHVRNLRNKLYPIANQTVKIDSVFGVGYRLRIQGAF